MPVSERENEFKRTDYYDYSELPLEKVEYLVERQGVKLEEI